MSNYPFVGKYFAPAQLVTEIVAAGLPAPTTTGFGFSSDGAVCLRIELTFASTLTGGQVNMLDTVVSVHTPTVTPGQKLDLTSIPLGRLTLALAVLQATTATAGEKTKAQALVDNAYTAIKNLLS